MSQSFVVHDYEVIENKSVIGERSWTMAQYLCSHSIIQNPFSAGPRQEEQFGNQQASACSDKSICMWSLENGVRLAQLGKVIPGKSTLRDYVAILLRRQLHPCSEPQLTTESPLMLY